MFFLCVASLLSSTFHTFKGIASHLTEHCEVSAL
uniref:Uncharacterized protein n=1 Tax=Anguilla anguilla TaxID=7936 RepID=A0A0E9PAX5_ANGAN